MPSEEQYLRLIHARLGGAVSGPVFTPSKNNYLRAILGAMGTGGSFEDSHLLDLAGLRPMTGQLLVPDAGVAFGIRPTSISRSGATLSFKIGNLEVLQMSPVGVSPFVNLDMRNNNRIVGLQLPAQVDHAANKGYVDNAIAPLAQLLAETKAEVQRQAEVIQELSNKLAERGT